MNALGWAGVLAVCAWLASLPIRQMFEVRDGRPRKRRRGE